MKKICEIINAAVFFAIIAVIAIVSFILPKKEYSELENRYLAKAPKLSADSYFSGDFTRGLSEYLDDSFPLRKNWISLHTGLELLQGRRQVNGVYIAEDRMLEIAEPVELSSLDESIEAIRGLSEAIGNVHVMLVPTAAQIYSDMLPKDADVLDQNALIDYVYGKLSGSARTVNVYNSLRAEREEYIYYRTDHHWTSLGAYIGYRDAAKSLGFTPAGPERFNIRHASHSFSGSLYSKTLYSKTEPDTIDFYTPISGKARLETDDEQTGGKVFAEAYLNQKDKYLCYLGKNTAKVSIYSGTEGGRLLIIKDSYANCLAPFLCEHYSRIDLIDLRYMTDPNDYIDPTIYDDILIIYNAAGFSTDGNLKKLNLLTERINDGIEVE